MRGVSKAFCIITGIIDVFLTITMVVFSILCLVNLGGLMQAFGGSSGGTSFDASAMRIFLFIPCLLSAIVCLIATICAFNAAAGKRGAMVATIIFGFMDMNIFAILGGIFGLCAPRS